MWIIELKQMSNITGHGLHTKGNTCMGVRNREREGNLKLECGLCAHCRGVNIVILLLTEATMGRGLESSEEVW
jgi:hypothetical protein